MREGYIAQVMGLTVGIMTWRWQLPLSVTEQCASLDASRVSRKAMLKAARIVPLSPIFKYSVSLDSVGQINLFQCSDRYLLIPKR